MDHDLIARNLVAFLGDVLEVGEDADVAINPELEAVVVFAGGELVLSCAFADLEAGLCSRPNGSVRRDDARAPSSPPPPHPPHEDDNRGRAQHA